MSLVTYEYQAMYVLGHDCDAVSLQRIDLRRAACEPTLSSAPRACANSTAAPDYATVGGCVAYADVARVGDGLWDKDNARVQFASFEDPGCAEPPARIAEYTVAQADCIDNALALPLPGADGLVYAGERLTADFRSGALFRTYFAAGATARGSRCHSPLKTIEFAREGVCAAGQTARLISGFGLSSQTLFNGGLCTDPSNIIQTIAANPCEPSRSCGKLGGSEEVCYPFVLDPIDIANKTIKGPFVTTTHFLWNNCSVPDYTETFTVDRCMNSEDGNGKSISQNAEVLTNGSIALRRFNGKDCLSSALNSSHVFTGNDTCMNSMRVLLFVGVGPIEQPAPPQSPTLIITSIVGGIVALGLVVFGIWFATRAKYMELRNQASVVNLAKVGNSNTESTTPPPTTTTTTAHHHSSTVRTSRESLDLVVSPVQLPMINVLESRGSVLSHPSTPVKENPLFRNMTILSTAKQWEASSSTAGRLSPPPRASMDKSGSSGIGGGSARMSLDRSFIDPHQWTVKQVADWVSQNGGTTGPVYEQFIDGRALMTLGVEDLFSVLKIDAVGRRVQFTLALESLKAPPPSYIEE